MITVPAYDPHQPNNVYSDLGSMLDISSVTSKLPVEKPATPEPFGSEPTTPVEDTLELKLFNNAASLKIDFSLFATALSATWRGAIFSQLDELLSLEGWNDESTLIDRSSFKTFLRFLTHAQPNRVPALAVDHAANLVAAWIKDRRRAFVTFLEGDRAVARFVGQTIRGDDEFTSWTGPVYALCDTIEREGNLATLND
jgi:hypothetical protein